MNQVKPSPLFSLEGPDDDGCVWISSKAGLEWQHNVGRPDEVAMILSKWLSTVVPVRAFALTQDE
jgi:hypothetical protein